MTKMKPTLMRRTAFAAAALAIGASGAAADILHLDDVIIDGSLCVGVDCVNGESFGFDTIRLKENNLRIKAQDTSSSASFPTNDWQLTFNDSSNGGANKFSIDDIDGSRTPFTIEAGTRTNALYLDSTGRVGFGTNTPVVDLHAKQGNTPTLRLEQDGSSGFASQVWDVAGNETNFFIRDASNGSTLPFRIRSSAPGNSLYIDANGEVGLGTASPVSSLHIRSTDTTLKMTLEKDGGTTDGTWEYVVRDDGDFAINNPASAGADVIVRRSDGTEPGLVVAGDVRVSGSFIANGSTLNVPDYVFGPEYQLMPLSAVQTFIAENSHLPNVPSAKEVQRGGLDLTQMQLILLEKIEELTLYTLAQEEKIAALEQRVNVSD